MSADHAEDAALEHLLADLERAAVAAQTLAGRSALGIRAIEDRPGQRAYLCAFEGPAFLCLRADLSPEADRYAANEVASAALLVEHLDGLLGAGALTALAAAAGRALTLLEGHDEVEAAVGEVAERSLVFEGWVADPARALASVPELDVAVRMHDDIRVAWSRFVRSSEPLAAAQEQLSASQLDALRGLEQAAGAAMVAGSLTEALADALPVCRAGAQEMLDAHVTPLR